MDRLDRSELTRRWRTVAGWVLIALGGVFILLGWVGVSGEPSVARQMSYLASGGLGGLAAAVVGAALLVSDDMRTERRRLGRIEAAILDLQDALQEAETAADEGATRPAREPRRSR